MTQRNKTQPNIVFVLTDDQGYGDLGCHGNRIVRTPSIDTFYGQSVRFTQQHGGSTCAPTRAGLLTGMNCNSAGVWHTIGGASLLRQGVQTLPEVLRACGYSTGLFGKWHLGDVYPYRPHDRGFQLAVHHRGGGLTQVSDHWGNNYLDDTYLVNDKPKAFKGYCTDVFFNEAFGFIRDNRDKPFCCFITPNAPHSPYNVERKYRDLYAGEDIPENRKRFYGMITNIDENFARLEKLLGDLNLRDNTILMFMTDNGTAGGCDQDENQFVTAGFNAGMRGTKASPYEGGHRVPFFMRYPAAGLDSARDVRELTSYIDFMPTLLDYCSAPCPPVEGRSLRPLLESSTVPREFAERPLVIDTQRSPYPIKWRLSSVMKENWRLICGRELYDLGSDPEQRRDISAGHPEVVQQLRANYEEWWELCTRQRNQISSAHVGSPNCPEVVLTTQELRNEDGNVVYHQGQVRQASRCLGWWAIFAEQAGRYEIALRRWPEETGYGITNGIRGFDIDPGPEGLIEETAIDMYRDGKAVDVYGAALKIDGQDWYQDLKPGADHVTFAIDLSHGPHELRAWFSGGNSVYRDTLMSPYYVTIKRSV